MAGARHEPHSGGSPRLGNPVKPDNLKPLLCDLPLPAKKSKNTRPPPGLTTHQARSRRGFRQDGTGTTPLFVRRGGYPAELRNERYGPYNGTAPGAEAGKTTNGWEYCGEYRMEEDDMVDGIRLSSMPELEQQHWLDCWTWRGRGDLVEDFKNDPESVLVASDRLVFVSYDEQLYKDLKAHQDKRVAEM